MQRQQTKRKIVITDAKSGKLRAVMMQEGFWGWRSKRRWKTMSQDFEFVMYVVQSWNRTDEYDIEIKNQSLQIEVYPTDAREFTFKRVQS
jgi:hypothetical protein